MRFILLASFLPFALRRLLTYLHIYQQEEYQPMRFLRWMFRTRSIDRKVSLVVLITGMLEVTLLLAFPIGAAAIALTFLIAAWFEQDPRAASKKKLVMTGRATRIYWSAFTVLAAIGALYVLPGVPLLAWLIPVHVIPLALPLANLLLTPYEKHVQQRFWNEAHQKLETLKPTVIGITGSYGKTSTKHLLGHILEIYAPTLITPGSVNTPMGIARIVREHLGSHHRFFICEMGAYGPGSIARLCRLAPPDLGILTAVGMAHYERFKSLETVARTKLELAESVENRGGSVIFNQQVLDFADSRAFRSHYREKTITVGPEEDNTFRLSRPEQTTLGVQVEVVWQARSYLLQAPLFGEHHIANMAIAFAASCLLGVPPDDVVTALHSAPQIPHRLEVKAGANGSRLIDDAYNSNPVGFASALQLLGTLQTKGGRRILVTPGMVELGLAHDEEHRRVGVLAATSVDVLLPVLPGRISTLVGTFSEARPEGLIVPCANFGQAQAWLNQNATAADIILLENDLPDLYEARLKL